MLNNEASSPLRLYVSVASASASVATIPLAGVASVDVTVVSLFNR